MTANGMILTDHFLQRIKDRNIPAEVVKECLIAGKKYNSKRNIIICNRFINCYMSVKDGAGLTIKLADKLDRRITLDSKRYGTSKGEMTRIYFKSIGYTI
jgi:hypothetical protein